MMNEENENEVREFSKYFASRGASESRANFMAKQFIKRADQLSKEKSITREQALFQLMQRMLEAQKDAQM